MQEPEIPQNSNDSDNIKWPKPYVTRALLGINIIIFVLMVISSQGEAFLSPSPKTLISWGADFGPLALNGEPWRLLSNVFIHIGIIHIAMNMYVLQDVSAAVELFYGSTKLLIIYLLAGIGGSLVSLYFNPMQISAGASGAVFGVYGALLAFFQAHKSQFPRHFIEQRSQSIVAFIIYNLIFGSLSQHIDNAAHIGGLIFGFIAGHTVMPKKLAQFHLTFVDFLRLILLAIFIFSTYLFDCHHMVELNLPIGVNPAP